MIPQGVFLFLFLENLGVSFVDIKYRKISNQWSILNIVIFIGLLIFSPDNYSLSFDHFIIPLSFFFVGFLLFIFDVMGGGDAKFFSTCFLLMPYTEQLELLVILCASTIVMGLTIMIYNIFKGINIVLQGIQTKDIKLILSCFGSRFAYAPVLLISLIVYGFKVDLFGFGKI